MTVQTENRGQWACHGSVLELNLRPKITVWFGFLKFNASFELYTYILTEMANNKTYHGIEQKYHNCISKFPFRVCALGE